MMDSNTVTMIKDGELVHAEDCVFMIDTVMTLFDRSAETGRDKFLNVGIALLEIWREALDTSEDLDASDAVLNIVMGKP